jgi:hypothetical protein
MKVWFYFFLFLSISASAAPRLSFSAGGFMKNEKAIGQADEARPGYAFAAGFGIENLKFFTEYYQMAQAVSGQETLAISSVARGLIFSGQFLPQMKLAFDPYLSAGAGFEQRQVTTRFYGVQETDNSRTYLQVFAGAGLRAALGSATALEGEGRLVFLENQMPSPAWLVQVKMSFDLNL